MSSVLQQASHGRPGVLQSCRKPFCPTNTGMSNSRPTKFTCARGQTCSEEPCQAESRKSHWNYSHVWVWPCDSLPKICSCLGMGLPEALSDACVSEGLPSLRGYFFNFPFHFSEQICLMLGLLPAGLGKRFELWMRIAWEVISSLQRLQSAY